MKNLFLLIFLGFFGLINAQVNDGAYRGYTVDEYEWDFSKEEFVFIDNISIQTKIIFSQENIYFKKGSKQLLQCAWTYIETVKNDDGTSLEIYFDVYDQRISINMDNNMLYYYHDYNSEKDIFMKVTAYNNLVLDNEVYNLVNSTTINNPKVDKQSSNDVKIESIETLEESTVVNFSYTNSTNDAHYIYLASKGSPDTYYLRANDKYYHLIETYDISANQETTVAYPNKPLYFSAKFEKVSSEIDKFDLIEGREGNWSFYGVSLINENEGNSEITSGKEVSFSCISRTYCDWNKTTGKYSTDCDEYDDISLFVMNKNETFFTHTTEEIKSTYFITSKEYDKENDVYTYDVKSDVGNSYYYVFDIKNKQIRAVFTDEEGKTKLVTFSVKAIF